MKRHIIHIDTSDYDTEKHPIPPARIERSAKECRHTPMPDGYNQWDEYAKQLSKTHSQVRCPHCGKWAIWLPKKEAQAIRVEDARQERMFIKAYDAHFKRAMRAKEPTDAK